MVGVSGSSATSARPLYLSCYILSHRRSKLEIVVQLSKVTLIGEKVRANFYGLAGMFHEEVPLAERKLRAEGMVGVPLCLFTLVSFSNVYRERLAYHLGGELDKKRDFIT